MLYENVTHPHKHRNPNKVHKEEVASQSFNNRLAVEITKHFGSIWAFYALIIWMFVWMFLATAGIWVFKNDPYPFPFLLFCSNLVQLWALPVLAVGQQVLSRKQSLQADEQFDTTTKSFHDIEQIMQHLTAQDKELLKQTGMIEHLLEERKRK